MDDQLDNDLKNHIREVFDNYEDTTADEGWLLLREKFPAEKKSRGMTWLWWAAAVLLVCAGTGLWLRLSTDKPIDHIVKNAAQPSKRNDEPVKKVEPDMVNATQIATAPQEKSVRQSGKGSNNAAAKTKPAVNYQATSTKKVVTPNVPANKLPVINNPVQAATDPAQVNRNASAAVQPVQPVTKNNIPPADVPFKSTAPAVANSTVATQQPKPAKTVMDMFKTDNGDKQPERKESDQKAKKINFGLYAGTYFNYGKGSDNQVNVGGGVTSDIKLNKKLKLVTGISIAQNSLSYQAIPTAAASLRSSLAVPASATSGNMYATLASTPTVKNYNASLVGLDIPINLKYEFNPEKTDAYVSLGLSSGTFIDESYTYKYNYPSIQSSSLKDTQNETTGNNFNSFYFAKTLNVAFGVGYPFGKNRLIIEPFLKYPLDGLGSQNLKFGAGGLNLKFNFLPSHK